MNIAIFSDTYRPMVSGITVSLDNHTKQFVAKGHRVRVYTIQDKQKVGSVQKVAVETHAFLTKRFKKISEKFRNFYIFS